MTDESIFTTALDITDLMRRAAYLEAVCADDPARRARVEQLLAAYGKAGAFLERPAAAPDPDQADTRTLDADGDSVFDARAFLQPSPRPGALGRIGHYDVLEVLGRGGFGVVFRAFDDTLQRVVAVKVLSPQMAATSPARKRFLREARSSAQIRHENVVQVHAVSRDDEPLPYLVMEFIPGETLQQRLDRTGPLAVAEVVRIGRQIAEGLAAAHATGLIHRDVKLANVLIEAGPHERAKLTDFGLARAADDASISQSGVVAGTPLYMSPEQARGETLDHRSDLFSLGSVLYTMLTGRPPFRASGTVAVLKRVCEEQPRPIREVIPEVSEWLCRIVEKLHAKNPEERFQTAREVADLLADCEKQLQAHGALKDTALIPVEKPPRPTGSRWKRAAVALLVAGVAVAGIVLLTFDRGNTYRYLKNEAVVRVGVGDPVTAIVVERDGERVETIEQGSAIRPIPPGRYELQVVTRPGFEPAEVTFATSLRDPRERFVIPPSNGRYALVLERGAEVHLSVATKRASPAEGVGHKVEVREPPGPPVPPAGGNKVEVREPASPSASPLPAVVPFPFDAAKAKAYQEEWAKFLGLKEVEFTNTIGMELRVIPPGDFLMGSTAEEIEEELKQVDVADPRLFRRALTSETPKHLVRITRPFAMGKTEVTVGQFRQFVTDRKYKTTVEQSGGYGHKDNAFVFGKEFNWDNVGYKQADLSPVWNVSWEDAVEFCKWLGQKEGKTYRLPTEAEWEYACRAGTSTRTYWGGADAVLYSWGPGKKTPDGRPQPVGKKEANAFGLRDMCGNVWEWCHDWYGEDYYGKSPAADPRGPDGPEGGPGVRHRVQRGGGIVGIARGTNSAYRPPPLQSLVGFRVVCEFPGDAKQAPPGPAQPAVVGFPFDAKKATEYQEAWAKHLGTKVDFTDKVLKMEFRVIPPGDFLMGAKDEEVDGEIKRWETDKGPGWHLGSRSLKSEKPSHPVRITRPFAIGKYEVTVGQFRQFIDAQPAGYKTAAEQKGGIGIKNGELVGRKGKGEKRKDEKPNGYDWRNVGYAQLDRAPVWNVTREDAIAFCKWLSEKDGRTFRLPTEAEWEWACRAGTDTRTFWGGTGAADAREYAWGAAKTGHKPQIVGGLWSNAFGLYDTCGNVWEWCNDWYHELYYKDSPVADPQGPAAPQGGGLTRHRVQRGGGVDSPHPALNSTVRRVDEQEVCGFRVVCEIAGDAKLPPPETKQPVRPPDPVVVQRRKEVEARSQARDTAQQRLDAGVASKLELLVAEVEFTEARIKLAEAEKNPGSVADLLEELVAFRQEERDLIAARVDAGKDPRAELDKADARLADAKARLVKVRPPEEAPEPHPKP